MVRTARNNFFQPSAALLLLEGSFPRGFGRRASGSRIGYSALVRPPNPDVPHDLPTDEERRLGSWFECRGCKKDWPLRLGDVRERRMCLNCGRGMRRDRQAATRARARDGTIEKPAPVVEASVPRRKADGVDLSDPALFEQLYEGRVPEEVSREIDTLIEQAVRRRGAAR